MLPQSSIGGLRRDWERLVGLENVVFLLLLVFFASQPIDLPDTFRRPRGVVWQGQAVVTDLLATQMVVVDLPSWTLRRVDLPGLQVYRPQVFENRLILPAMNRRKFYEYAGDQITFLGNYANYGFLNLWLGPSRRLCAGNRTGLPEQVMLIDGPSKRRLIPASPLFERWHRRDGNFLILTSEDRVFYVEPAAMDVLVSFKFDGSQLSRRELHWPVGTIGPNREHGIDVVTIANGFKADDGIWLTTQINGYCLSSAFFGADHPSPLAMVEGQVIGTYKDGLVVIRDGGGTYRIHISKGDPR